MFHDLQAAEVWCNMDLGVLGPIWQKYGKYENAMEKNKQNRIFFGSAQNVWKGGGSPPLYGRSKGLSV